jgi:hypothetical protein
VSDTGADGATPGGAAPSTVADVLVGRLRSLGVGRIHGLALGDLPHVPVADPDLAVLLADADGRLGHHDGSGRLGAALLAGGVLHLSSAPGGRAPLQTVGSVEELLDALADVPGIGIPGTSALHLDMDLRSPVPAGAAATVEARPQRVPVLTLDPTMSGLRLLAVVGPGVVRLGGLDGLRSFTRTAGAPVLATWGAAGVERWDSPWHVGVGGLQARDLELAGLAECDVVVASGLDPAELPSTAFARVPVQEVPPRQLGALCARWSTRAAPPEVGGDDGRPSLRSALARVLVPGYESDGMPLHPARAALHLSGALPDRGVAVADPGQAGLWIARSFPTSIPGSLCVPAASEPGFAAAAALVAGLEGRPALAVTDAAGANHPVTVALLDLARSLGVRMAVQVWRPDGPAVTPAEHAERCRRGVSGAPDGVEVVEVGVDVDPTPLLEVAGPVVAWGGSGSEGGP